MIAGALSSYSLHANLKVSTDAVEQLLMACKGLDSSLA